MVGVVGCNEPGGKRRSIKTGAFLHQGGVGEERDTDRPDGFIDSGTRKIRRACSCDKQYKRILPGGKTYDGRLDEGTKGKPAN